MNPLNRWTRAAGALTAAAAVFALAAQASAEAAPLRTATTTSYNDATFLQHTLGLPTSNTSPAIEPVTYDRFQWLLQQPGRFAFLVGDPAVDPSFKARAQDVEVAAQAAGARKVYWFDPNLSGSVQVGSVTEQALDIRTPALIALATASQTKYDNAWKALVGQYLGDGLKIVQNGLNSENATVTVTTDATQVNDSGRTAGASTNVGNTSGGALYDYTGGTAPAKVTDSYFLVYDKDRTAGGQPQKIASWTDLTTQATSSSTRADVTTALGTVGAANLTRLDQFAWWKDEVNAKQVAQSPSVATGGAVPTLTDADNATADGGWRINQVTYPEIVDLLQSGARDANAVILFGGTWCPNTRPVLPAINRNAQQNGVQVFNFDTVLDGGLVGGSTTAASDPLQSRNTANNGSSAAGVNANPTGLYGDLVNQFLTNNKTEYDYTATPAGPAVTYYPGHDTTLPLSSAKKLQVPFLIGYQGTASTAPSAGVTRQWIIDKGNGTFTEYMSSWQYTNPQPGQLGLSATQLPQDAPIWSTINTQLANVTWATDPATLYPSTTVDTDDAPYLVAADKANVTSTSNSVTITSSPTGSVVINPDALSAALAALGASAPTNLAAAKTALLAAKAATTPDSVLIGNLTTVTGAWGIAQSRKSRLITTWGTPTSPSSVLGGLAAVHAADVFFGGLPGGVVSRRTVTAPDVASGAAPKLDLALANDYGRVPTGTVSLIVKKGGTTVVTAASAVSQNAVSFTIPVLDGGTYDYALTYPGDDQLAPFTETGSLTVASRAAEPVTTPGTVSTPTTPVKSAIPAAVIARIKASKVKGAVSKAPTSRKAGRYAVTITTPKGFSTATGKVTVKLAKGKTEKKITATLKHGVATFAVPKLARGTWKVTITWPGDEAYLTASATGTSIKVAQ